MLYWFRSSVVSLENSQTVVLSALSTVVVGLPLETGAVVLQLRTTTYGKDSSVYTTSMELNSNI